MKYRASIDGGRGGETTIQADTLGDAWKMAVEWTQEGDWDTSDGPVYCDLRVWAEGDEDHDRSGTVVIDQPEPKCESEEGVHAFEDDRPPVVAHGGGVIIREICVRCGVRRRTDTWAQNPVTGEQGLREVTYLEAE